MAEMMKVYSVGDRDSASSIALMLTRRCNMTCAHCSVKSGPKIREEPTDADIISIVESAAEAGLTSVQITGGEPMLRERLVFQILKTAKKRGVACTLTTNGFWGRNQAKAWRKVAALRRAGLIRITVSYDRYHAKFMGPGPALNIARAAEWFDLPLNINVTRVRDDPEIDGIVAPFAKRHQLKMRFYDVQAVGRARELPMAELRGETTGFCNACCSPAITDDGRMTACNGPSYFLDDNSPLVVGSLRDTSMKELIDRHTDDPILETIRRAGPQRLLQELEDAGVAREFGIRRQHSGLCDLCTDINSKPAAVAVLRERLARPAHQAGLAARRMVIKTAQIDGALNIQHVNGIGVSRLWMDAAAGKTDGWSANAERTVGRADFDWNRNANYLQQCGLARSLAPILEHPGLKRWAPTFFIDRVRRAGVREGLVNLAQRDVIRRLGAALAELGETGVLLKGGALIALDAFDETVKGALPTRGAGDIDILVQPAAARRLRARLVESGFSGACDASQTGPHHLAPVSLNGIAVEIHTSIMPGFWRLPETEMLSHTRPVAQLPSLATLDAEGMILHALVHSTAHVFSRGLRAAWDSAWLIERTGELETERLLRWIEALAMPRSFWVPARVLGRGLVPLPARLLERAPTDERQRRMERVAELRIFSAVESAFDLNPISKNGFFLMLHDSYTGRARHIASLFGRNERESRRSAARAREHDFEGGRSTLSLQIREGTTHWRQFQRAISG